MLSSSSQSIQNRLHDFCMIPFVCVLFSFLFGCVLIFVGDCGGLAGGRKNMGRAGAVEKI